MEITSDIDFDWPEPEMMPNTHRRHFHEKSHLSHYFSSLIQLLIKNAASPRFLHRI